ncbi:MAG: hypothetical protein C0617_07295 [Desulfuromonas sp.]|uniref:hypothetical protein n=1 Tax=Desulfuromonas sp. TaxID=892 RepID=UPI000CB74008|nr:hypothetical protein [Desulfuromonas sp.]PLX84637.1 MAG: hypothetical protein C0617_07295 [Desulfuromonas sp.]
MMRAARLALATLLCVALATNAFGLELKTRFATVEYERPEDLRTFNKKLRLGSFSFLFGKRNQLTVEEEVGSKVDKLNGRVQEILEMFPRRLRYKIVLVPSRGEVQQVYRRQYGTNVDFIAFYAPETDTVYVSVSDIKLTVLAHELAHVVINHYFENAPPVKIHEVLAQYVEAQMEL